MLPNVKSYQHPVSLTVEERCTVDELVLGLFKMPSVTPRMSVVG